MGSSARSEHELGGRIQERVGHQDSPLLLRRPRDDCQLTSSLWSEAKADRWAGCQMSYHTTLQALASKQDVSAIQRTFDAHSKKSLPIVGVLQKFYPGTLAQSWHDAIQLFFSPFPKEFRYADKKAKRKAGRLYCHSKGMRLADIKMIREAIKGVKGGNHISLNDVVRLDCSFLVTDG